MNERVPDSSRLPLRAMVMVLLFLGVVFLLVGFQAMGSGGDTDDELSSMVTVTTTTTSPSESPEAPPPVRPEVRVFNISEALGVAGSTADRLREADWNVTEVGNLVLPDVPVTTVYFGNAPGEREAADEVGQLLEAPVEPRLPEIGELGPGIIVLVMG